MVDADIINRNGKAPFAPIMNHWIVLHGAIMIDGLSSPQPIRTMEHENIEKKIIKLRFWTWGRNLDSPYETTLTTTVQDFLSCYFGYVSANPF
jgi:hypothetical protein